MKKSLIILGLFLAGAGLIMLLPGFILSLVGSSVTKTSHVTNIIFDAILDIFQDERTGYFIEETRNTIVFFERLPYFLVIIGGVILIVGLIL
ncbi:MAG: hypothetical protein QXS38_00305 [Candidatus Pacearchaeota archaeon]